MQDKKKDSMQGKKKITMRDIIKIIITAIVTIIGTTAFNIKIGAVNLNVNGKTISMQQAADIIQETANEKQNLEEENDYLLNEIDKIKQSNIELEKEIELIKKEESNKESNIVEQPKKIETEVDNKQTMLRSLQPILSNKDNYTSMDMRYENTILDNLGNEQKNVMMGGYFESTYIIDGKYEKLDGTIFIVNEYKNTQNKCIIEIYGDDAFIESIDVTGGEEPKNFSVSVSGVKSLKIAFDGHAYNDFAVPSSWDYGGVSNLILY